MPMIHSSNVVLFCSSIMTPESNQVDPGTFGGGFIKYSLGYAGVSLTQIGIYYDIKIKK